MNRSSVLKSPVLSFLSSSPASSRRTQQLMQSLFSLKTIQLSNETDELDETIHIPGFIRRCDSVALKCEESGAILHFLSFTTAPGTNHELDGNTQRDGDTHNFKSLLAVTGQRCSHHSDEEGVQESRRTLASLLDGRKEREGIFLSLRLTVMRAIGRAILAEDILGFAGLPYIDIPTEERSARHGVLQGKPSTRLKEVAIPFYDEATYPDGSSIRSRIADTRYLARPALGLYQWPSNGVALRPLPAALDDRILAPPSLVFQCRDLGEAMEKFSELGVESAKIGYSGLVHNQNGQLILNHPDFRGLDVRLTDNAEYCCGFAEAQEALMAASLDELQSANVLLEGGTGDVTKRAQSDSMNGRGDCWIEVRANLKRPSGYMKRVADPKTSRKMRIAKAPDLPYE